MSSTPNVSISFRSSEFVQEVKQMTTALKQTQSEFKLTDAQLQSNGTKLDQLKNKYNSLGTQLQQQQALTEKYKEAVRQASEQQEASRTRLEKAKSAYDSNARSLKTHIDELKKQATELDENSKEYEENVQAQQKAEKQLKRLTDEVRKAENAVKTSDSAYQKWNTKLYASETAEAKLQLALKETNTELTKQQKFITQVSQKYTEFNNKTAGLQKGLTSTGKTLTTYVTAPLVAAGIAAGKVAVDFEDAFAGVEKTVDGTPEQMEAICQGIRNMAKEIPETTENIAALAEAGGQLGIHTDSILTFTRTMADLGVATNLAGEEGAATLAKFANIMQMPQENFDRLGSTIVDLGNNLATTEADIAAMGLRLAGAGAQIGLSEAQILGLAGALSSVGIEAEAGGSAFSKVMINMQLAAVNGGESLKDFAKVAGMSTTQFKKAFETDAAGAMISFIEGLGNAQNQGSSAIEVLSDMEITEVRMRDALLRASSAGDLFREAIERGTNAWEENVALTNEASKRYETTASQIQIAKNNLIDAGIALGQTFMPYIRKGTEKIKEFSEYLSTLDDEKKEKIIKIGLAIATIGPALTILSKGITVFNGARAVVSTLASGTKLLGGAMTALAGPAGIAVGALALVAGGTYAIIKAHEAAEKAFYNCGDAIEEATNKYTTYADKAAQTKEYTNKYRELTTVIKNGLLPAEKLAEAEEERKEVEKWLIDNYGDVISAEEEKKGIKEETLGVIERMTEAERKRLELELQSEIQQNKNKIPELKQSIEDMQRQNKVLEAQYIWSQNLANELMTLKNDWEAFARSGATEEDKAEKLKEIAEKAEKLTGMDFSNNMSGLTAYIEELTQDANDANEKIAENNQKIQDGTESIEQYNDAVKEYANVKLDGKYDEITESLFALITAQNELNDTGQISEDTMKRVLELIPEFQENADKPEYLQKSIETLSQKLKNAGVDVDELIKKTDKIPREIPVNINIVERVTSAVSGGYTYGTINDQKGPRIYPKVNTSLNYNIGNNADGTNYAQAGPSVVNEEGPELIQHKDGTFSMAQTSPAIVPLREGDVVYTAEETRRIMGMRTIQHFKDGTGYDQAKKEFQHRKNIMDVSTEEEIAFWEQVKIQYVADDDAVIDADENLYKLRKELAKDLYDYQKELTEDYIKDRTYNNDWDVFADSPFAAFERARARWEQDLAAGTITEKEYYDNVSKLGEDLYNQRRDNSEKWLEQQLYYGKISQDDYIAGLERERAYTQQYYEAGLIDFQTYNNALNEIDKSLYDERKSRAKEFFEWQKQISEEYIEERTYNNDWSAFGDDPISAYNRVKERWEQDLAAGTITEEEYYSNLEQLGSNLYQQRRADSAAWLEDQKYYDNISTEDYIAGLERQKEYTQQYYEMGIISFREYNEAIRELNKSLYDEHKAILEQQVNDYYQAQKDELDAARKAIEDKYNLLEKEETQQEREESLEELRRQETIYAGAVTIEGKKKLEDIRKQIAELEKQQLKEEREEQKEIELQEIEDRTEALEEEQKAALQGISKYARELTGIFGQSSQEMSDAFLNILQKQDEQQQELMNSGYSAVCNIVDNTTTKIAEFEERVARLQHSLAQLGIMGGLGVLGGIVGIPATVTATAAGPQYTMNQQNTYYVQDETDAEIIGRKSGRAFMTMGNISG